MHFWQSGSALRRIAGNYGFILPALVFFLTFSIYPFYKVATLSFFEWDGIAHTPTFVGGHNFLELLRDPIWWTSFAQAAYITVLALVFQNALALGLALAINRELRAGRWYRVIFFLPPILSGIVVGLIWSWIYDGRYGVLNHALQLLGLGAWQRSWLSDPATALTAVAVIHMWKGFGWGFIILLAGLQSVPVELYEAARVDGAGPWERFWHVTVPLMVPIFFQVSILTVLGTMQIFDVIVATTQGGPGYHTEVPVTRILATMLGSSRFGYACSLGVVFGFVLLASSMIQQRVARAVYQG
ncbi:MAG: sugar ABC transporter permease [Candidatus Omnitrophica bacterium]|nr:sugar ABC transporter permease [Candidatus Omnitrophota bacterium]